MGHGGHSIIARGLYALQIRPYIEAFSVDQLKIMGIGDIKGEKLSVQESMDSVFKFIDLPSHDLVITYQYFSINLYFVSFDIRSSNISFSKDDISPKNSREYDSMNPETRTILEDFYRPFNTSLLDLLGVSTLNW
jgi:hypothetical protein